LPEFSRNRVEYEKVNSFKLDRLNRAFINFRSIATEEEKQKFSQFKQAERHWLDDYALFRALKDKFDSVSWTHWPREYASRQPEALQHARRELNEEIATQEFFQFTFFEQWNALKAYCAERDIRIMGDLPIYVAHDSADVWAHPEHFCLDESGNPTQVAGVPPDYFSSTGQLWGNPIYRWDRLAADGYSWWIERFRASFNIFDIVRLDHFRGFEAYWEVPAGETTAINGRWKKGPGAALFVAAEGKLGPLPIVAENLGVITPEVEAMRERFGFPGMAILQFAFGADPQGPDFRPHNYPRNLVAYTGTHDNDTVCGWWRSKPGVGSIRTEDEIRKERDFARAYLAFEGDEVDWVFIRALMASVADTVIFPLQDVLGIGSEARMNIPGTATGNWGWRAPGEGLTADKADRLRRIAEIYDRQQPSAS
jgi:4-alpha-glucanotransferase